MEFFAERFEPGAVFAAMCVVFVLTIPIVWLRHRGLRGRATVRFSTVEGFLARSVGTNWAMRTRWVIPLLRSLAIVTLVFALARPQLEGETADSREGIAIGMVLDISGSMREQDFVIDGRRARRIDAVKRVFKDFVLGSGSLAGRSNDLIGMTTFAMYADTRCPLTLDHANLANLLDATDIPGWVDGVQRYEHPEANNTSLGDAIVVASDELRRAGEQAQAGVVGAEAAKSRVMILLTDGANNPPAEARGSAPDPVEAARLAAKLGIKAYTIGAVGSARGGRRSFFGPRVAEVDEPTLKQIAAVTGGKYFRATDTDSLVTIYDEIDKLERRETGERTYRDNTRGSHLAMLVGLGLLMMELFLTNTRYRRIP